ncbi:MAG TPA: guanylate kinase [Actinomycetota bacterium]|nr:guanylate kinase [Actinomycetota bacterium]
MEPTVLATPTGGGSPTGRGRLVVLAGPSGVGKGAITSRLLAARPDLRLSVSATTRPARPDEVEERHYYFVDSDTFDRLVHTGGLLEWAEIFGNRYGTPREPVERAIAEGRDVVVEIDVQGARQIRAICPDAFMVFIKPPSLEELERRLRERGTETDEQVRRRLAKASDELAAEPEFDVSVVNDVLDEAANLVIGIFDGLRRRTIDSNR